LKVLARLRKESRFRGRRGLFGQRFGGLAGRRRARMFGWRFFAGFRGMGNRRERYNRLLTSAAKMQPQKSSTRE